MSDNHNNNCDKNKIQGKKNQTSLSSNSTNKNSFIPYVWPSNKDSIAVLLPKRPPKMSLKRITAKNQKCIWCEQTIDWIRGLAGQECHSCGASTHLNCQLIWNYSFDINNPNPRCGHCIKVSLSDSPFKVNARYECIGYDRSNNQFVFKLKSGSLVRKPISCFNASQINEMWLALRDRSNHCISQRITSKSISFSKTGSEDRVICDEMCLANNGRSLEIYRFKNLGQSSSNKAKHIRSLFAGAFNWAMHAHSAIAMRDTYPASVHCFVNCFLH